MAAQNGKDLLVKIDTDGAGSFVTLAGLRATRISLNSETVDATSLESGGWRELLGGAGAKSIAVTGSGIFRDELSDTRAREIFFAGSLNDYQLIVPDFGTIEGAFQITSIEYAGTYDGEATYEIALASAGTPTFTAA